MTANTRCPLQVPLCTSKKEFLSLSGHSTHYVDIIALSPPGGGGCHYIPFTIGETDLVLSISCGGLKAMEFLVPSWPTCLGRVGEYGCAGGRAAGSRLRGFKIHGFQHSLCFLLTVPDVREFPDVSFQLPAPASMSLICRPCIMDPNLLEPLAPSKLQLLWSWCLITAVGR
jgi:hypothetical protein